MPEPRANHDRPGRTRGAGRRFSVFSVGLAVALALLSPGCAAMQKVAPSPSARVTGVSLRGVTLTALTLDFEVEVENPYAMSLPVMGMDYKLSSSGAQFLSGSVEESEAIPAHETGTVDVPVTVPYSALTQVIPNLRPGTDIPFEADLGLTLDAPILGAVRVPMKHQATVRLPSFP